MQLVQYWENSNGNTTPCFVKKQIDNKQKYTSYPCRLLGVNDITDPLMMSTPHIAQRADILRAEVLSKEGGMYIDADAILVKNVDFLFDFLRGYNFIGFNARGKISDNNDPVRVGVFLCSPGSEIVSRWNQKQKELLHAKSRERYWCRYGAHLLTQCIKESREPYKILPMSMFYPLNYKEVKKLYEDHNPETIIKDDTYGVMTFFSQRRKGQDFSENSLFSKLLKEYGLQEAEKGV